ncbi:MAG: winged helix domain-containing protein, partial [Gammaproteobacteria bacterium]
PLLTYQDPDQLIQEHSNEIKQDALDRVSEIFKQYLQPNHPELQRWFGRYVSDSKTDVITEPEKEVVSIEELQALAKAGILKRHPGSRFAFAQNPENTLLFIDGEDYEVNAEFAKALCKQRQINLNALTEIANNDESLFIIELYNQGKIVFE